MKRYPVASSHIAAVGYDDSEQVLEVEFQDGSVYSYTGVPHATYHQLITAGSVGKFFYQNIRDRFDAERV